MPTIAITYHKGALTAEIPDANFAGVFESGVNAYPVPDGPVALCRQALDAPIGSPSLETLAVGKKNCVVIASDHTRPVPSRVFMPELLRRLRVGNPDIRVTLLIATGCHRPPTRDELVAKFGETIVAQERIVAHDASDRASLVCLGRLPSGSELWVNKLAAEAELLVSEGFIEPHFFAGYSGGRKSVLPGVAGRETVLGNHRAAFIADDNARAGVIADNPIHLDMTRAAELCGLAFIFNVVLNGEKRIIKAVAGHFEAAHREGREFLDKLARVSPPRAPIVVTGNGGYPLDQNLYQAVKGMTAAEAACLPGGTIVMVAACSDGHGGEDFYRTLAAATSPKELLERVLNVPGDRTQPDQWQYQILARILSRFHVIFVSDMIDPKIVADCHMEHAADLPTALDRAFARVGRNAQVAVIPDGVAVMVSPLS